MDKEDAKLEKLGKILKELNSEYVSENELIAIISTLTSIIESIEGKVSSQLDNFGNASSYAVEVVKDAKDKIDTFEDKLEKALDFIRKRIDLIEEEQNSKNDDHDGMAEELEEKYEKLYELCKELQKRPLAPKATEVRDLLQALTGDERLSANHIKDLPQFFERVVERVGTGFIETQIKAGENITIQKDASGAWVITSTASATGYQVATGTVNGVNTVFDFTQAPNALSVDGVTIQKTSKDGTVNWTGTTTITLTVAPNFDIFGIA